MIQRLFTLLPVLLIVLSLQSAALAVIEQAPAVPETDTPTKQSTPDSAAPPKNAETPDAADPPAKAAAPFSATIQEQGVYAATLNEEDNTIQSAELQERTREIPRKPGTLFGIRYAIQGGSDDTPVTLTIRVEHPPLTDPESGETLEAYTLRRQVTPGKSYLQLQRLPEDAPAGGYRILLQHQKQTLATQSFTLQGPSAAFSLLEGELQARCRSLTPKLGGQYANASLLTGHTFALRLPPTAAGANVPASGEVCFLALGTEKAAGLALSDMQGRLLAPIQPLEPGLDILAVSFLLLDDDQLPEILLVARNTAFTPPLLDSRVYFAVQKEKAPAWGRRPDLDARIAKMQSALKIKRWLEQNTSAWSAEKAETSPEKTPPAEKTAPATSQEPAGQPQ